MTPRQLRKQVSIFVPLSDWKALREEAARQNVPITELCRRWMDPQMEQLRRHVSSGAAIRSASVEATVSGSTSNRRGR